MAVSENGGTGEEIYIHTVTSRPDAARGVATTAAFLTMESIHFPVQETSLGVPDVEPLVWKMNITLLGLGVGKGGRDPSSLLESE